MSTISEKSRELDRLRALSQCEGWKDILLPRIVSARDAHNNAATARNSTPEKRAEHVEAYHLAKELAEYVPNRIEALTKELAANESREGASTLAPALSDRQ